ncbi:probable microtubule-binding protein TANGLED [Pyrus x bretschneideri]|uniref:probable microtubule-binding protein TANGLED n=1 Tax=Pyrus x bretschneideri TaxID=225117 RepID=UPI002030C25C|nr:probable microtubule-binding protein TANGLED [Pyrus x bretschneideri]
MVARTPPKQRKMVAPLNPLLLRETVKKVDRCMARLQELQYTVSGGTKVISGVSLSPRSTRGYLRTSLRCKQETARIKGSAPRKSPVGKFPANAGGEWQRMSLPAMLVDETVGEILQASKFAREIIAAVGKKPQKTTSEDPKTPMTQQRKQRQNPENTELRARRKKEKHNKSQSTRSESGSPILQRARSRINFKVSPPHKREMEKENNRYLANRVSPKNRPWAKKSVLFPNPLFSASDSSQQQKFCRTRSPVIGRNDGSNNRPRIHTPHKFLIKSPPSASKFPSSSKFQIKIRSPPLVSSLSPTKAKKSPKMSTASKLRRSFSPSRLATRLVSPLKSRKSLQKSSEGGLVMHGLKQRPTSSIPMGISARRI